MSGRRHGRRAAGFTLLEVAVALAILGMGVVTCLQVFSRSLRLQATASRRSRVVLHARAVMDSLLFQPDITDHTKDWTTAEGFETHLEVRHAGRTEGVDRKDLDFVSDLALRYLQVDVRWQEGAGVKRYTLQSMRVAPENE
jgi:general secretion pathway protein I